MSIFLSLLGCLASHWIFLLPVVLSRKRMQHAFGELGTGCFLSPPAYPSISPPLHILSVVLLPPIIPSAFFISLASTSNSLQWNKTPAHPHLPPSILLCVWGLTLLHPCISLLSVSGWNLFNGSSWMNILGFSPRSCEIAVYDQTPASCRFFSRQGTP